MVKKILISGLVGERQKGLFEGNIGNNSVIIPMFKMFKKVLPEAKIFTTINLSDSLLERKDFPDISVVVNKIWPMSMFKSIFILFKTILNLIRCILYKVTKIRWLSNIQSLNHYKNVDLILNLDGDIFCNTWSKVRVLILVLELLSAKLLGKPVVEWISSPGPFRNTFLKVVGKCFFNNINLIINRELESTKQLYQIGIRKTPILSTACTSWLMKNPIPTDRKIEGENIKTKYLIGITISRFLTEKNFSQIIHIANYFLEKGDFSVMLLPHSYKLNPYVGGCLNFIDGPDYNICKKIYDNLYYKDKVFLVKGKYDIYQIKQFIGKCNLFITGRLHGGVSSYLLGIPTILISYGHKFKGFANLVGQEKLIIDQETPIFNCIDIVEDCWENREIVSKQIKDKTKEVKKLAEFNFKIIKELIESENIVDKIRNDFKDGVLWKI